MKKCFICGEVGDRHHIIHKDEGGLDYPLNYIYLCKVHHRGRYGPHENEEVDAKYKKMLLQTLKKTFPNDYYTLEEVRHSISIPNNLLRTMTKNLKHHKEGFRQMDIIDFLTSGNLIKDDDDDDDDDFALWEIHGE